MQSRTAAVFRLEGSLLRPGALTTAAYFAANGQGLRDTITRLGGLGVVSPFAQLLGQTDRVSTLRLAFAALRGMSEDRIDVLAEEFVDRHVQGALLHEGVDLVQRARREGHQIVYVSESIAPVIDRVLGHLPPADFTLRNTLEMRNGRASGKLEDPVVGSHETAHVLRTWATEHGIDLHASIAYASRGPDVLLLTAVGNPCAVNPDFALRQAARGARWPILTFAS